MGGMGAFMKEEYQTRGFDCSGFRVPSYSADGRIVIFVAQQLAHGRGGYLTRTCIPTPYT